MIDHSKPWTAHCTSPKFARRPYRIAFMLEATGDFEIVKEFEALNDDDANRYAETNYDGQQWYVLDAAGRNVNGGDQE